MRVLLFLVAFAVALAASAPLEQWVMPAVERSLPPGAQVRVDTIRLAAPAGLRARGVSLSSGDLGLDLDSLYVGLTRSFEAEACGGRLGGSLASGSVELRLDGVDPARCVRAGRLALEAVLDGRLAVSGLDLLAGSVAPDARVEIDLSSAGGSVGGIVSGAGRGGADVPLGEWEFRDLALRASVESGDLRVEEGRATTSGVEWQLLGGHLPMPGSRGALRIDLRVRAADQGQRAKALLSMMPKAAEDADGWRRYRVTGTLASPRFVAAD